MLHFCLLTINGEKNGTNRAKSKVGWNMDKLGSNCEEMGEKWAELSKEPRVGRVKLQGQAPLPQQAVETSL